MFGKENQYADTPGWADFGGGTDNNESYLETAIREGVEETTGFLGNEKDMRRYYFDNVSFFLIAKCSKNKYFFIA